MLKDKQFLVAFEEATPHEIGILENPFDLANEGIQVSNSELQAAKNFKWNNNVTIDMNS